MQPDAGAIARRVVPYLADTGPTQHAHSLLVLQVRPLGVICKLLEVHLRKIMFKERESVGVDRPLKCTDSFVATWGQAETTRSLSGGK